LAEASGVRRFACCISTDREASALLQVSLQPWPQQDVPEVVPLEDRHGSMDAGIDRIVEVPGVDGTDSKVARWIE
jgi:hypothetical protein